MDEEEGGNAGDAQQLRQVHELLTHQVRLVTQAYNTAHITTLYYVVYYYDKKEKKTMIAWLLGNDTVVAQK